MKWIQYASLKIISIILHVVTLGIPKLLLIINDKIKQLQEELNIKE
ncbi:MAG: hypothetical protein PPFGHCPK_01107 [Spiroplasma endosymbiont of Drosophila atripex]|nr:MAG: hypothetical protein PPFGHCPK_01107 [Spiroplasma endosymbiont of Drosophila atripex]